MRKKWEIGSPFIPASKTATENRNPKFAPRTGYMRNKSGTEAKRKRIEGESGDKLPKNYRKITEKLPKNQRQITEKVATNHSCDAKIFVN